MRATTAMGERARQRGGRRGPDDADRRGWEAAAREGLGWEAAAREEGLRKGLGHRWEGGGGVKGRHPRRAAGRTAGFSPAERLDPAQRLEPAPFSLAEQAE
jgi:hypothetical protein